MKLMLLPALALMIVFTGCGGDDRQNSGTITLTSELYEAESYYYALGLSFDEGKEVPTLPDQYRADITVQAGPLVTGGPEVAYLSANTLNPPFALTGEYATEGDARNAFEGLTSVGTLSWIELAAPLKANQVWVVKTRDNKYAKLRTIEVTLTTVPARLATCRLEWVYQPDGSTTFP
ncbi:MAG: hypothetical protein U5L72_04335 [Bacteroidales bacterium]|nr:hypothetical protein [Bacteroidales bacterium]